MLIPSLMAVGAILPAVLVVLGISYCITGARVGYPIRLVGWIVLHRTPFDKLVLCPPCNSWWVGAGVGWLLGYGWVGSLQLAFTACIVMQCLNHGFHIVAEDEDHQATWENIKNGT